MAYALSDEMKIIDFGWPWRSVLQLELYSLQSVFSSDSWAFLYRTCSSVFTGKLSLRY